MFLTPRSHWRSIEMYHYNDGGMMFYAPEYVVTRHRNLKKSWDEPWLVHKTIRQINFWEMAGCLPENISEYLESVLADAREYGGLRIERGKQDHDGNALTTLTGLRLENPYEFKKRLAWGNNLAQAIETIDARRKEREENSGKFADNPVKECIRIDDCMYHEADRDKLAYYLA